MIASLGDVKAVGTIPQHYGAQSTALKGAERAFVERVYEARLKVQNYDKGFEKFIRKFEKNEAMYSTVALLAGNRNDRGWAVFFKQGPCRGLLMDTVGGFTGNETLWTALAAWATFKPRRASPRKYPGKLFYPAEASHIFEKYWDHLTKLDEHPGFAPESPKCQKSMVQFSRALDKMRHKNLGPLSTAEAQEKDLGIAEEAALSRLRPIPDGPDQWALYRSSTGTVGDLPPS
jgi:hypothetical protein